MSTGSRTPAATAAGALELPGNEPVRVGRFEWERLLMMSNLPEQDRFKLLAVGIFMSSDGSSARPGNSGLALFGFHEETWKQLLRRTVKAGWLVCVERGGARRGPAGTTIRRASVYAAAVPQETWARRDEILGSLPFRRPLDEGSIPTSLKEARGVPDGVSESLKEASEGFLQGVAADVSEGSREAPEGFLRDPLKEASGVLKEASDAFEGSPQRLPHHVVTPSRTSTTPTAPPATPDAHEGGGGQANQDPTDAAVAFLRALPSPWGIARPTAAAMAPELIRRTAEEGWELGTALAVELTQNPGGIFNHSRVLRTRIEQLRPAPTRPASAKTRRICEKCDKPSTSLINDLICQDCWNGPRSAEESTPDGTHEFGICSDCGTPVRPGRTTCPPCAGSVPAHLVAAGPVDHRGQSK